MFRSVGPLWLYPLSYFRYPISFIIDPLSFFSIILLYFAGGGGGRPVCLLSNERQPWPLKIYPSPSARDSSHKSTGIRVTFYTCLLSLLPFKIGRAMQNSYSKEIYILVSGHVTDISNFTAPTIVIGPLFLLVCYHFSFTR